MKIFHFISTFLKYITSAKVKLFFFFSRVCVRPHIGTNQELIYQKKVKIQTRNRSLFTVPNLTDEHVVMEVGGAGARELKL